MIKIMVAEGGIKDVRQGISKIALSPDYVGLFNNFFTRPSSGEASSWIYAAVFQGLGVHFKVLRRQEVSYG